MGEHDHGEAQLAELLDLDGEVLHRYWADALSWMRAVAGGGCRRILDLGAGSGVGTIALAQRFAGAEVVAVDVSDEMLERIRIKALDLGLADRVHTVQADLDVGWPDLGTLDVTWASLSLHHLADPGRVLGRVFAATRPGGLVAVAEMSERPSFLPHDLGFGRPGIEARLQELLEAEHQIDLDTDWASRLAAAGFAVLDERRFEVGFEGGTDAAPADGATARYADRWLRRLRSGLADRLAADDLAALDMLLDGDGPGSLRRRDDLQVRGSRTVTLARRP